MATLPNSASSSVQYPPTSNSKSSCTKRIRGSSSFSIVPSRDLTERISILRTPSMLIYTLSHDGSQKTSKYRLFPELFLDPLKFYPFESWNLGKLTSNENSVSVILIDFRSTSSIGMKCQRLFRPQFRKIKIRFCVETPYENQKLDSYRYHFCPGHRTPIPRTDAEARYREMG